ncbi:MAG: glycerol-3-phosphate dehydrogenase/oxidase [Verrucomicrobiae bacterium]|nr:glycerol-3-phosphate dehydrogenase/oxidase [Verrucomicrobiae bacterium]
MSLPSQQRQQTIQQLTSSPLDVLIIGGGIVGTGIARDAAMRGLRTGLVDQHDFAFGTSSRSSRLLHGGLRYLAQGRVGLVREASLEKVILHSIVPHLAQPLPFLFPTYSGTDWHHWQLCIGVKIYDLLCNGRNFKPSKSFNATKTLSLVPSLEKQRLAGAVYYYDALTNDARMVIDTLRSAGHHGSLAVNYLKFEDAEPTGQGWNCRLRDVLTGKIHQATARTVVSATGPWADQLPHSCLKLRPTKGVHLVIDHARFPVEQAIVMTCGKRILFVIPWGRRVILGTTDTDYKGPVEAIRTEEEDIQNILDVTNQTFPPLRLTRQDIRSTWVGLRSLVASRSGHPSEISRSHEIRMTHPGWLEVAGGKLTTNRLMAEQATDQLVQYLKIRATPCATAKQPLLSPAETNGISGVLPPPVSREIVEHHCRNEWAIHLDDIMVRRTSWHYYEDQPREVAKQTADWMTPLLGWDDARKTQELTNYCNCSDFHPSS